MTNKIPHLVVNEDFCFHHFFHRSYSIHDMFSNLHSLLALTAEPSTSHGTIFNMNAEKLPALKIRLEVN